MIFKGAKKHRNITSSRNFNFFSVFFFLVFKSMFSELKIKTTGIRQVFCFSVFKARKLFLLVVLKPGLCFLNEVPEF